MFIISIAEPEVDNFESVASVKQKILKLQISMRNS